MRGQMDMFKTASASGGSSAAGLPDVDRFRGAFLLSATGDALGWPTEFLKPDSTQRVPFKLPVENFVKWNKFVGGRWWGYQDEIEPGAYSDDTQLALAVARCLSETGEFEPERFAYAELPLWLHYERGGGRSIKSAARALVGKRAHWLQNFYKSGDVDYRNAGANGAAMRNFPIALASCQDEHRLIRDSFYNAIITHGHPRAILGTILIGLAVRHALMNTCDEATDVVEALVEGIGGCGRAVGDDRNVRNWIGEWEKRGKVPRGTFKALFAESRQEAERYLREIPAALGKRTEEYYGSIGALNPSTKGSGLATVCAAIYLFLRYYAEPEEAILAAANQIGSDTDTISSFVGALVGAQFGTALNIRGLTDLIQDREYLAKVGDNLHAIAGCDTTEKLTGGKPLERDEAYLRILAWEIGLHELFWDAIDIGGMVVHPTLGRGSIMLKDVRKIAREGFVAKLVHIEFDSGQSCIFHSRVKNNDEVSESLAREVQKALGT